MVARHAFTDRSNADALLKKNRDEVRVSRAALRAVANAAAEAVKFEGRQEPRPAQPVRLSLSAKNE